MAAVPAVASDIEREEASMGKSLRETVKHMIHYFHTHNMETDTIEELENKGVDFALNVQKFASVPQTLGHPRPTSELLYRELITPLLPLLRSKSPTAAGAAAQSISEAIDASGISLDDKYAEAYAASTEFISSIGRLLNANSMIHKVKALALLNTLLASASGRVADKLLVKIVDSQTIIPATVDLLKSELPWTLSIATKALSSITRSQDSRAVAAVVASNAVRILLTSLIHPTTSIFAIAAVAPKGTVRKLTLSAVPPTTSISAIKNDNTSNTSFRIHKIRTEESSLDILSHLSQASTSSQAAVMTQAIIPTVHQLRSSSPSSSSDKRAAAQILQLLAHRPAILELIFNSDAIIALLGLLDDPKEQPNVKLEAMKALSEIASQSTSDQRQALADAGMIKRLDNCMYSLTSSGALRDACTSAYIAFQGDSAAVGSGAGIALRTKLLVMLFALLLALLRAVMSVVQFVLCVPLLVWRFAEEFAVEVASMSWLVKVLIGVSMCIWIQLRLLSWGVWLGADDLYVMLGKVVGYACVAVKVERFIAVWSKCSGVPWWLQLLGTVVYVCQL